MNIKYFLWVGLGGGIGAMLRFLVNVLFKSSGFPLYTLLINVAGSFLLGIIFALTMKNDNFPESLKLFLATGICGGFTTFSAFSLENMTLIRSGEYSSAGLYIFISVTGGIVAAFLGFRIAAA